VYLLVGVLINRSGRHIMRTFMFLPQTFVADSLSVDQNCSHFATTL